MFPLECERVQKGLRLQFCSHASLLQGDLILEAFGSPDHGVCSSRCYFCRAKPRRSILEDAHDGFHLFLHSYRNLAFQNTLAIPAPVKPRVVQVLVSPGKAGDTQKARGPHLVSLLKPLQPVLATVKKVSVTPTKETSPSKLLSGKKFSFAVVRLRL